MSTERWYSKFTWRDWRSDTELRLCSLAARGLWMDLLALAHDGRPYGHVTVAGRAPDNATLAALMGGVPAVTPDEIERLLGELEARGVLSKTSKGVIFSRRMVRDFEAREAAVKNGKRGGNPLIMQGKGVNPSSPKRG